MQARPRTELEGWFCTDQMTIDDIITAIEEEEETGD